MKYTFNKIATNIDIFWKVNIKEFPPQLIMLNSEIMYVAEDGLKLWITVIMINNSMLNSIF